MEVHAKIGQQVLEKITEESGSKAAAPQPQVEDIDRFRNAVSADSPEQAGMKPPAAESGAVQPAGQGPGLGDRILKGMESMKNSQDRRVSEINTSLETTANGELSTRDLMRLQLNLVRLGEEREITSKVVGKSSENIQTLMKNQ